MFRSFLLFALAAMPLLAQAIEEPSYEVTKKLDDVEILTAPVTQMAERAHYPKPLPWRQRSSRSIREFSCAWCH
jgi:hypothetical protein